MTGTGSEKQVSWANSIRQTALNTFDSMEKNFDEYKERWLQSSRRQSATEEQKAEQAAEYAYGYSKEDIKEARKSLVSIFQDQMADAKLIIDRRSRLSPAEVANTVKLYARKRRNGS